MGKTYVVSRREREGRRELVIGGILKSSGRGYFRRKKVVVLDVIDGLSNVRMEKFYGIR